MEEQTTAGTPRPAVAAPHHEPGTLPCTASAPYGNERCGAPIHNRVLVVITSGESGHDGAELARRGFPIRTGRHVPISGIPQPARRERRRARLSERIKAEILAKRPRGEAVVRPGLKFQFRKPSTGSDLASPPPEADFPQTPREGDHHRRGEIRARPAAAVGPPIRVCLEVQGRGSPQEAARTSLVLGPRQG